MAGNLTPQNMFDHDLNAVKGWPSNTAVDKAAVIDPTEDATTLFEGSVVHIDAASSKFKRGVASRAMPMFLIQNGNDFDANSDKYGASSQVLSALVANGGYELQTTEFVTGGTYAPNTMLTAATAGDAGKVVDTATGQGTQDVVGVCSSGVVANAYKKNVITFWPCYLPQV